MVAARSRRRLSVIPARGEPGDKPLTIVGVDMTPKWWGFVKHCREMGDVVDVVITERYPTHSVADITITFNGREDR
jgi:hypothetical protein